MTTPAGYTRSAFRVPGSRTLAADDARGLIGHDMEVSIGDVVLCSGTVTDCRVVDEGANFWVTVESGGRGYTACGHVYPEDEAASALRPVSAYREAAERLGPDWLAVYADLPDWAPVCATYGACRQRKPAAGDAEPGGQR